MTMNFPKIVLLFVFPVFASAISQSRIEELNERIRSVNETITRANAYLSGKEAGYQTLPNPNEEKTIPLSSVPIDSEKYSENSANILLNSMSPFPLVEEISGQVARYEKSGKTFVPLVPGYEFKEPTLLVVSSESEVFISFPGRIAACVSENSRIIVGPQVEGRYTVDLRNGTISAMLDPDRDLEKEPAFAVRTLSGTTEAVGTLYAVTEFNMQTFSQVDQGKIVNETSSPTKNKYDDYLKSSDAKNRMSKYSDYLDKATSKSSKK